MTSPLLIAGGSLAALVVLLVASGRVHRAWVHRRFPPRGSFAEVRGVRVHYTRRGTGPPVLLLHGLNGFMSDWDQVCEDLARDHEVVIIDRPGHGHSVRRDHGIADPAVQAHWLAHLMDELGLEDPLVVGHSWGGALALTLALRHPDRVSALVLVAPYAYPGTHPEHWFHRVPRLPLLRSVVAHTFVVPVGWVTAPIFARLPFEPEEPPDGYLRLWRALTLRPGHFDTVMDELRSIDPALHHLAGEWDGIHAPTAILTGDADRSIDHGANALRLAGVLPDAELEVYGGAGHMLPYTRAGAIVEAVRRVGAMVGKGRG